MASTGGGAARSGKKRNPDVADPEEASQAELVGTVGTNDAIDRKLDLLVTTVAALADSANKLINADVKVEEAVTRDKFIEKSNASSEKKKKKDANKMQEKPMPEVTEIAKLAYANTFIFYGQKGYQTRHRHRSLLGSK